jgi:hypothetical protein
MTTAKILKGYANEDLQILIDNGALAMTDTAFLCPVWFTYENKVFTASKGNGEVLLTTNRKALIRDFIMNCFKVM